jgi:hypothetical protein
VKELDARFRGNGSAVVIYATIDLPDASPGAPRLLSDGAGHRTAWRRVTADEDERPAVYLRNDKPEIQPQQITEPGEATP